MSAEAIFDKANDAIERQNYGYAIELLGQVLLVDPKNVKARQRRWMAARRAFAADPNAAKSAKLKTMGPWVSSVVHSLMGKPNLVIQDCEQYLMLNPESAQMRDRLGQAALQAGDMDLAIAAYESAREVDPKNPAALRHLGRLYKGRFVDGRERDDLNNAMACFEMLLRLRPTDHEAKSEAQWLAAQRAIEDGGWDTAKTARDLIKDKDEAAAIEESLKVTKGEDEADKELTRIADAIKAEPDRANLYVRQGDLLLQKKRYKSAEESFLKAQSMDKTNTFTRARLGDVKIAYMQEQLDTLKEQLAARPGDAAVSSQAEKLGDQLRQFKVADYRRRVQEQPTNMEVHHDLGKLLFDAKDFDGAMQMFQKSMADPRFRVIATHMLGKCLVEKKMYDRAVNMLKRAVEGAHVMNETVKSVYYDLGVTYEKMGQFVDAEAAYGKIYDADVGFRDVGRKMEEVYKKAREKGEKTV